MSEEKHCVCCHKVVKRLYDDEYCLSCKYRYTETWLSKIDDEWFYAVMGLVWMGIAVIILGFPNEPVYITFENALFIGLPSLVPILSWKIRVNRVHSRQMRQLQEWKEQRDNSE